jgi:murein DD-endopeptidase MepM/ murein hydrolase activator NlpD
MDKHCFVIEFAHALDGSVKRIRFSYKVLAYVLGAVGVLSLALAALFSSYLHMSWQVAHYNELRANFDRLRTRYQELQRVSRQHNEQMASLESLASEVTVAYGLNGRPDFGQGIENPKALSPNVKQSLDEFNVLRDASYSGIYHHYAFQWQTHTRPSSWPLNGVLRSSFGGRSDPFSGEGAFHTGIDLSAPVGTPVHATADGVVGSAGWSGAYGKLVIVEHGNGLDTYYAHLSQFLVLPGEEVHRGQVIGLSGDTGRATGPHVHYEVRFHGTPVNPYRYLDRPETAQAAKPMHSDLGL